MVCTSIKQTQRSRNELKFTNTLVIFALKIGHAQGSLSMTIHPMYHSVSIAISSIFLYIRPPEPTPPHLFNSFLFFLFLLLFIQSGRQALFCTLFPFLSLSSLLLSSVTKHCIYLFSFSISPPENRKYMRTSHVSVDIGIFPSHWS